MKWSHEYPKFGTTRVIKKFCWLPETYTIWTVDGYPAKDISFWMEFVTIRVEYRRNRHNGYWKVIEINGNKVAYP